MFSALVTGASSGIGRAIARALLERGWDVSGASRDPDRAQLDGLHPIVADLSVETHCSSAVDQHVERCGGLDLLVNNSGVGMVGQIESFPTEVWDYLFDVNAKAPFLLTRAALPHLRTSQGQIVNISSIAGLRGLQTLAAYSATKHALVGFTRSFNAELAHTGVRATAICPGYVATPMTAHVQHSVSPDSMIQPEDIARMVCMLLDLSPGCVVNELVVERRPTGNPTAPMQ